MEWTYMKNIPQPVESESVMNLETESRYQTPTTSESSIMALDSAKPGKPLKIQGTSSPSSSLLTELNECDQVSDLESVVELPPVPQYDACFGVVSHRGSKCGSKGCR